MESVVLESAMPLLYRIIPVLRLGSQLLEEHENELLRLRQVSFNEKETGRMCIFN